jgi:predicted acyl esterase
MDGFRSVLRDGVNRRGRKAFVESCATFLKTYPQQLIDVYPDSVEGPVRMRGYELMVAGDVMRGRYWKGFQVATPIPSNTPVEFTVDLHQLAYTFQRGHRVMVQVHSTWFPLYDRNPQTFVPNIFKATATDYRAQTPRVLRTQAHPSNVEVMVLR